MTALEVSMTGLCECGHTDRAHADFGCSRVDCDCADFTPRETGLVIQPPAAVLPQPARVNDADSIEHAIRKGLASPVKRTVALAEKIDSLIADLRVRVDGEVVAAKLAKEIADLEAKLAEKKAALRGEVGAPARPAAVARRQVNVTYGAFPCPDCGEVKTTAQGVGVHRAKAHGYRRVAS